MEEITQGKVYRNGEESVCEASMPSLDMPSSQNIYIQPGRLLWMYNCSSTIELFYMFVKNQKPLSPLTDTRQ